MCVGKRTKLCATATTTHWFVQRTFFSEIISTISDIKFSRCGRYMLSRDYMTVKLWDIHRDDKPVSTFNVQEPLRGKVLDGVS